MKFFLFPLVSENLVSRDGFGSPVPRQPAHLQNQAESGAYGILPEFRGGVHLFILHRHTPLGQSRVYRVTQLRTDGVHCRESAGTGLVNHKVVPNGCCLGMSPFFFSFSFISLIADGPHPYHPACGHKGSSHLSPVHALQFFLSRCKFSTLTTRQPMAEFYLLTFPRFPLRKKEHKSYFGKNRTHDFRTSRYAAYLLDHSGDERR